MNPERDFREDLRTQLLFIQNSCTAYDLVTMIEAIRIATAIRIIFHDTKNSVSLLQHLKVKDISLLSTAQVLNNGGRGNLMFEGLLRMGASSRGFFYSAPLSKAPSQCFLKREDRWNQVIHISNIGRISRKLLILTCANKDGGAHVDAILPPDYQGLKRGVWNQKFDSGSAVYEGPLPNTHLPMLRQIGYEILNSPDLLKLANMTGSVRTASEQ